MILSLSAQENVFHLLYKHLKIKKVTIREVRKTNKPKKNGNGQKKYNPEVVYRHLGADVWGKQQKGSDKEDIAYSSDIEAELDAQDSSELDEEE